jgi:hypothetical protein
MNSDINKAKSSDPIKNGTLVTTTSATGTYSKSDIYVNNTPTISDIENKYHARFYNGIFVQTVTNDPT